MVAILRRIFGIIFSVKFIMGTLGNGFIALMNIIDWVKGRKISSVDQILTALAISRITLIWLVFIDWWVFVFYPSLQMTGKLLSTYFISWTVMNHFKNVVLITLLVSLFILFLNIVLVIIYSDMCVDDDQRNVSHTTRLSEYAQICKLLSFTNPMFLLVPFVMALATFLFLIFSLWRHLKSMQHTAKTHIRALQTVIVSVLFYTIFFLSFFFVCESLEFWVTGKIPDLFVCLGSGKCCSFCSSICSDLGKQ
ncbi:Tas2r113 [Phodopus roborovskii]|uniref:Tas2r113 protein n=1 Tax=Phodopus roborovskii TaxID=109678 RepID=A0AAV0AC74_PHORO|nr:Tas2r113 [Phodopus roborovskii]